MEDPRSLPVPPPLRRRTDGAVLVPAGLRAAGRLVPPPSKSLTHRAYNLALLAERPLVVERPLDAEDTRLFRAALAGLGWTVEDLPEEPAGKTPGAEAPRGAGEPGGTAGDGPGGGAGGRQDGAAGEAATGAGIVRPAVRLSPGERPASAEIFCGNAGTLFRFLVASLAVLPGEWRLDGVPRLRERPVGPLVEALRRLGAEIGSDGADGYAPLAIRGRHLPGGRTVLDAGSSSQFLSAVLMAALVAEGPVEVEVPALTSAPYVDLTLDLVAAFGGRVEGGAAGEGAVGEGAHFRVEPGLSPPQRWRVEADLSAVAYPAAAAALTGGRVVLEGVRRDTRQGDRVLLDLLAQMGARVEWQGGGEDEDGHRVVVEGTGGLRAVTADLSALPDQVPSLAALAPFAEGVTRIENVPHLRIKESDRLAAMAGELTRAGATVEELPDGLVIPGVWAHRLPPSPAEPIPIDPHGDHRIAMALALVALRRPGLAVTHPQVVAKSYPGFWRDLAALLTG